MQIAITPRRTYGSFSSRRKQHKRSLKAACPWDVNFNFISHFLRGQQGYMFNWHENGYSCWPLSLSSRSASPSGAMQWQVFTAACLLASSLADLQFLSVLAALPPFFLSCRRPLPRNDLWRPQNEGRKVSELSSDPLPSHVCGSHVSLHEENVLFCYHQSIAHSAES